VILLSKELKFHPRPPRLHGGWIRSCTRSTSSWIVAARESASEGRAFNLSDLFAFVGVAASPSSSLIWPCVAAAVPIGAIRSSLFDESTTAVSQPIQKKTRVAVGKIISSAIVRSSIFGVGVILVRSVELARLSNAVDRPGRSNSSRVRGVLAVSRAEVRHRLSSLAVSYLSPYPTRRLENHQGPLTLSTAGPTKREEFVSPPADRWQGDGEVGSQAGVHQK